MVQFLPLALAAANKMASGRQQDRQALSQSLTLPSAPYQFQQPKQGSLMGLLNMGQGLNWQSLIGGNK